MNKTEYLWLAGKILTFTFAYFLGRLNFSFSWMMPVFFSSIQEFFSRKREAEKLVSHEAWKMDERDMIFSRLEEIPAWVLFPDFERVEWINKILKHFWPTINFFVMKAVSDFEPVLQQQKALRTFKFVKIDLGSIIPRVTGIKVHDRNNLSINDVLIDLNVCYFSDCEVIFSLNQIECGIKDIEAEAALRITLKLMPYQAPFVSDIQLYFLKHPTVRFELTAALASVNMFLTGELMQSLLREQISSLMVYPNKIQIKIDPNASSSVFEMPVVDGVVRMKILSVDELEEDEIFAYIELGRDVVESDMTAVESGKAALNLNCNLIAYQKGVEEVHISINTRDEDSKVAVVGRIFVKVEELKEKEVIADNLRLEPSGILSAEVKWLCAHFDKSDYDKSKDYALLQVYIESARNISAKHEPYVEVIISPFVDKKQTSSTSVKNEAAVWKKYFNFFVKNPNSDVVTVRIYDKHSQLSVGFFTYQIRDLFVRKTMEHELQAFPLTGSANSDIIMALKLNILKE